MSQGRCYAVKPRSDIYCATFAPAQDQGFVDRSEDIVIQQDLPTLRVRSVQNLDSSAEKSSKANVVLHVDSSSPFASYSRTLNTRHQSLTPDIGGASSLNIRKSSLQVTPNFQQNKSGYQRLENSSSETNINTASTNRLIANTNHLNESSDNMYQSTTTVLSDVQSFSVDNSLYSLNEEAQSAESNYLDFNLYNQSETLPSSIPSNQSVSINSSALTLDSGFNGTETVHGDYVYAKVQKGQKNTLDKESAQRQNGKLTVNTEDWSNQRSGFIGTVQDFSPPTVYTVTCTAELKDDCKAKEPAGKDAMSFDDTIKVFENFAMDTLEHSDDFKDQTVAAPATNENGQQTDRSENVIEYSKHVITKTARKKPETGAGNNYTSTVVTDSNTGTFCETSFTVLAETPESGQLGTTGLQKDSFVNNSASTNTTGHWTVKSQSGANDLGRYEIDLTLKATETLQKGSGNDAASEKETAVDLESELNDSMKQLLMGINIDTNRWTELNKSAGENNAVSYQVLTE